MKIFTPEISWHSQDAIFTIDLFQVNGNEFKAATAGIEKNIKIWRLTRKPGKDIIIDFLSNLKRHQSTVNVVRFSPDGQFLASGDSEGLLNIWELDQKARPDIFKGNDEDEAENLENWTVKKRFREHKAESDVCDLCWSPDSKHFLSCSSDGTLIICDTISGKKVKMLHENVKRFPVGVAWDPQNEYLVTMSNDRVMGIYSTINYQKLHAISNAMLPQHSSDEKKLISCKLFHDSSLMSYVRRPCFTPDGLFLLAPAGCQEDNNKSANCSYIFNRTHLRRPCVVLPSLSEPSIGIYCCQKKFKLLPNLAENLLNTPYRILFAVLTKKSLILYHSQSAQPFAYITNIHYVSLTDCSWSADGSMIVVSSEDGYCTIVTVEKEELGDEYETQATGCEIESVSDRNRVYSPKSIVSYINSSNSKADSSPIDSIMKCKEQSTTPCSTKSGPDKMDQRTPEIEIIAPIKTTVETDVHSAKRLDGPRRVNFITLNKQPMGQDITEKAITKPILSNAINPL